MEATLYGDLARIQVATDMTYEHYMDMMETAVMENDWAMMEASDDAAKKSIVPISWKLSIIATASAALPLLGIIRATSTATICANSRWHKANQ